MQTIYQPQGKAREYSPFAVNLYSGCDHGCKYCYVPNIINRFNSAYQHDQVKMKPGYIAQLEKNCKALKSKEQVLLSFTGDPYCKADGTYGTTREALYVLLKYNVPTRILTKGGTRCLRDLDIFSAFNGNISVGATLTFDNDLDSLEWESGAQLPEERIQALKTLHENGIRTWASFEPVIDPVQSQNLMWKTLPFVDEYKIGKLNNYKGIDKTIDWTRFLTETIKIMESAKKDYYIKVDLHKAAPSVSIKDARKRDQDYLNLRWRECNRKNGFETE